MPLELTIVTADKRFHYPQAAQVVVPTPQGQLGILPGHAPLVSLVACGVLRISHTPSDPSPTLFALATGMARIANDHIVLLMSEAVPREEVDRDKTINRNHELALAISGAVPPGPYTRIDIEEEAAFTNALLEIIDAAPHR